MYDLMWYFTSSLRLFSPIFLILSILGIAVAISRSNWFSVWIGLEINLYSFIPFLLHLDMAKRKESAGKYFVVQATGSIILLTAILLSANHNQLGATLIVLALLLKGGIAPIHFWFPRVIATSSWLSCFLLSTTQKVAPVYLLINFAPVNENQTLLLGSLIVFIGGVGGINQTQLRAIIAYSSIAQIGWVVTASQISSPIGILIFINYLLAISLIISIFSYLEWGTGNESSYLWKTPSRIINLLIRQLISMGGVPPFPGFIIKAIVLSKLARRHILAAMCIILASLLRLYFYLKIILHTLFSTANKLYLDEIYSSFAQKSLIFIISTTRLLIVILLIFPWLIM